MCASETGQGEKMESDDPALTTVVKTETDVAEQTQVSWITPTEGLGSTGEWHSAGARTVLVSGV